MFRAFIAACAMAFFAVHLNAENATYSIVIRSEAVVDGLEVTGRQIAGTYGGILLSVNAEGSSILVRLSDSRARMAAKDPRFVSVTVAAEPKRPKTIATDAEVVPWRTGVSYEYDGAGNVKKIASDTFVYDVASRLVQSTVNGETRKFEYDAFGNRTKCTQGTSTDCQGHTINSENNRITGANVYDAAGNVTQLDGHQYSYDALNRMTSDTDLSSGMIREYIYTADDERIAVYTVNQWWRWTIRDTSGKVLREYMSEDADGSDGPNGPDGKGTANWQWVKDSVWRGSQLLATRQIQPGSTTPVTYHYHLDHLGTPRRITDGNDRIVGFHDYHAFGPDAGTGKSEPSMSLFKYTGHERDIVQSTAAPLDYMHARYYSPTLGRFLSPDSGNSGVVQDPQAWWNRYAYARNNPLARVDPDGREDVVVFKTERNPARDPANPWGLAAQRAAGEARMELKSQYPTLNVEIYDVTSVSEVESNLARHKDIVRIYFIGHSDDQLLAIGHRATPGSNISMRGTSRDVSPFTMKWGDVTPNASIVIFGCHAGDGQNAIAQSIANATGVPVTAPNAFLNFNENTGAPFIRWFRSGVFKTFLPVPRPTPPPKRKDPDDECDAGCR